MSLFLKWLWFLRIEKTDQCLIDNNNGSAWELLWTPLQWSWSTCTATLYWENTHTHTHTHTQARSLFLRHCFLWWQLYQRSVRGTSARLKGSGRASLCRSAVSTLISLSHLISTFLRGSAYDNVQSLTSHCVKQWKPQSISTSEWLQNGKKLLHLTFDHE